MRRLYSKGIFKSSILVSSFVVCSLVLIAQDINTNPVAKETVRSKNHFTLHLSPVLVAPAQTTLQTGHYRLGASRQLGVEIGLDYTYHVNHGWALTTGLRAGVNGRNYLLTIPKEDFPASAMINEDFHGAFNRSIDMEFFSIPLQIERRWALKNERFFHLVGGTSLRIVPERSQQSEYFMVNSASQPNRVMTKGLHFGNHGRPWFNYHIGTGFSQTLRNHNLLRLSLIANYSPVAVIDGDYLIEVPGQPVATGTYSVSGSSIGVQIGYVFTGARKQIRRAANKS